MISWGDFRARRSGLAQQGGELLYYYGVGLAFLGTVRPDGGPRLHPMCPLLTSTGLCAFMSPSPSSETSTGTALRDALIPLKRQRGCLLSERDRQLCFRAHHLAGGLAGT